MAWYDNVMNAGAQGLATMGQGAFNAAQGLEEDPYAKPRGTAGLRETAGNYAREHGLDKDYDRVRQGMNDLRNDPRKFAGDAARGAGRFALGAIDDHLRENGIEKSMGQLFDMGKQLYNDPRKFAGDMMGQAKNFAMNKARQYTDSRGITNDLSRAYGMAKNAYNDPRKALMGAARFGARQIDNYMGYNQPRAAAGASAFKRPALAAPASPGQQQQFQGGQPSPDEMQNREMSQALPYANEATFAGGGYVTPSKYRSYERHDHDRDDGDEYSGIPKNVLRALEHAFAQTHVQ